MEPRLEAFKPDSAAAAAGARRVGGAAAGHPEKRWRAACTPPATSL